MTPLVISSLFRRHFSFLCVLLKPFPTKYFVITKGERKLLDRREQKGGDARAQTHTHTQRHTLQQGKGRTPQFDELKLLPSFPGGGLLPSLFLVLSLLKD